MLHDFLLQNRDEILQMTELKSLDLAGRRCSSVQLKQGLPIFYEQLIAVLRNEQHVPSSTESDKARMADAAEANNEPEIARASGHNDEIEVAKAGGIHGVELLRLGYTLSHVVHAYGAMCQSITELATQKRIAITAREFHDLNRCLDVAIAGAVTEFQLQKNTQETIRTEQKFGFLAHELRNALNSVNISLHLIRKGTVGFGGSTGHVLDRGLKRIERLIDRSLTEVRLREEPKPILEPTYLLHVVDQIIVTAEVEARMKGQSLVVLIDSSLIIEVDQQFFYSALSNLIQNAIKFTRMGGTIQIRGNREGKNIVIEVEDECGGLTDSSIDLFKPFEQQNANRDGLGLGLTIARRAILLNQGTVDVQNLPGKGCIFKIHLPGF